MHRPRQSVCLEQELKPDINRLARSRLISARSEIGLIWYSLEVGLRGG
jgi:hypothetical protein